jgi:phytoene synthase
MNAASGEKDAAAFCADLVRRHDFARYAATLFISADQRRALLALYAFNAEITRVRDLVTQPLTGEIRLQWWSDMLAGQAHGGIEGNPVAAELLSVIESFNLPIEKLSRLIEEHQFDLYNDPMPTLAALEGYLSDTSSALFALAAHIAAPPSPEIDDLARHAGLAHGFVRVVAALPHDASRRQLFVPQQLLAKNSASVEDVFAGRQTVKLRAAIEELLGEACRHLGTALSLLESIPPGARPVFLPLAVVERDLARLSRAGNDPFVPPAPSHFSTLWTLWRASRSKKFRS